MLMVPRNMATIRFGDGSQQEHLRIQNYWSCKTASLCALDHALEASLACDEKDKTSPRISSAPLAYRMVRKCWWEQLLNIRIVSRTISLQLSPPSYHKTPHRSAHRNPSMSTPDRPASRLPQHCINHRQQTSRGTNKIEINTSSTTPTTHTVLLPSFILFENSN